MWGAVDGEPFDPGRQRDWSGDPAAGATNSVNNLAHRLVQQPVIVRLQTYPDLIVRPVSHGFDSGLTRSPASAIQINYELPVFTRSNPSFTRLSPRFFSNIIGLMPVLLVLTSGSSKPLRRRPCGHLHGSRTAAPA